MVSAHDAHALVSYFKKAYTNKYGVEPSLNRYKARYGAESVLMDMDAEVAKELIEFYFTTPSQNAHSIDGFFYNYEKLLTSMEAKKVDDARREEIRSATRERTEQWNARRSEVVEIISRSNR